MASKQSVFSLLIVSDPPTWERIQPGFPGDADILRIEVMPFSEIPAGIPDGFNLMLFAIRSSTVKRSIDLKTAWMPAMPVAVIGDALNAHEVVRLMKAGFAEVFDLSQDVDLLREWVLSHYQDDLRRRSEVGGSGKVAPQTRIRGNSPAVQRVRSLAVQASEFEDLTVLIEGETGTGKEMVARLIHENSARRQGPFIEVNCAAIPETLMEAEMLGYEKGAFTDARRSKRGFFELADRGTLFLDEIGVMPLSLQNKILKIVEEKKFRRLGGESEVSVNVKILAGTNVDLQKAVAEGRFRPDLYYRLKVFHIPIPSLRDRSEDIPMLADFFLNQVNNRYGLKISGFHPASEKLLSRYTWPGNVRELKHVIERACVLAAKGRILPNHLPEEIQSVTASRYPVPDEIGVPENSLCIHLPPEGVPMQEIERRVMQEVLKRCNGNQSSAARFLNISRTRLIRNLTGRK